MAFCGQAESVAGVERLPDPRDDGRRTGHVLAAGDHARHAMRDRRALGICISSFREHALQPHLTSGKAWPLRFERPARFDDI